MVRASPYIADFEKGLVYLFQFPRMKVVPSGSPYCFKLETWLRMADIPYKNVEGLPMTIRSKEGTLPFVELDGKEYDDSEFIIRELTVLFNKQSMEAHLNDHDKAAARGIEKLAMLELLPISAKGRLPYVDEILRLMPDPGMIRYIMFPLFKRYFRNR
ncbi:Protein Y48C3A.3, partial [Aphelenchoides avenae]